MVLNFVSKVATFLVVCHITFFLKIERDATERRAMDAKVRANRGGVSESGICVQNTYLRLNRNRLVDAETDRQQYSAVLFPVSCNGAMSRQFST